MTKKIFLPSALCLMLSAGLFSCAGSQGETSQVAETRDTLSAWGTEDTLYIKETQDRAVSPDFVSLSEACPDIMLDIRYYSTFNFVGRRIPGYEAPKAYLTRVAADSLSAVNAELMKLGYRLKVHDAYRPKRAVDFFVRWGKDMKDQVMKEYFYPQCPKSELFHQGYLAHKSGHSRGSTVDVSIFDMKTGKDLDAGSPYDMLDVSSHYDNPNLTKEQKECRKLLRQVMSKHNFKPISCEWWHFTLRNEPFPNTYFDFPIK